MPGRSSCAARPTASRHACGMPSGGSAARQATRSSWTRRPSATCRARSPSTVPVWPAARRCRRHHGHARRALDLVGDDDHLGRGAASALLGLAYWTSGDLDAAYRGTPMPWRASRRPGTSPTCSAAPSRWPTSGSRRGGSTRRRRSTSAGCSLRPARGPMLRGAADMHVGMSAILRERNDLAGARHHLLTSETWARRTACRRTRIARVSRWLGSGRPRATSTARSSCSTRPNVVYVGDFSPDVRPVAAPEGAGVDRAGQARRGVGLGARARPVGRRRPRPTCASSSTSPSPGCCWRRAARPARRHRSARRIRLLDRLLSGRSAGGGRGASSTSWSSRRSRATPRATERRARVARARHRPGASPRATSASSSTRATDGGAAEAGREAARGIRTTCRRLLAAVGRPEGRRATSR